MAAAAGTVAATGAGFAAALVLLPPALVLPVTAIGLLLAAATLAALAWLTPGEVGRSRIVFFDIAGALAVIGLCAALLGEPEQAIALIEPDR
jgi:hypothetical protein